MSVNKVQQMKMTILGSGTCVPSLTRRPCSLLVETKDACILVDAGPGTLHQLLKAGRRIDDLDALFLSHFHLDHSAEAGPLLFATKYPEFTRNKPLTWVGGQGLKAFYGRMNETYGNCLDMEPQWFDSKELDNRGRFTFKDLQVHYETVAHNPESRAFRFEDRSGFSCVYSGDTDESEALIELARGADILVCECAMPEGQKIPKHLTPSLAGKMAQAAKVGKLVLTHFYPACEDQDLVSACRSTYSGPIVTAEDLMII